MTGRGFQLSHNAWRHAAPLLRLRSQAPLCISSHRPLDLLRLLSCWHHYQLAGFLSISMCTRKSWPWWVAKAKILPAMQTRRIHCFGVSLRSYLCYWLCVLLSSVYAWDLCWGRWLQTNKNKHRSILNHNLKCSWHKPSWDHDEHYGVGIGGDDTCQKMVQWQPQIYPTIDTIYTSGGGCT